MRSLYASSGVGRNWWINQTVPKIPLGRVTEVYSGGHWRKLSPDEEFDAWMRYPMFNGEMISDTILIAGGTGSGKSVQGKLVLWFISQLRPVIVFDWAGKDAYLMHEPNSQASGLPPNTKPAGIPGNYLYYPTHGARIKKSYERTVRPNLCKYNTEQLMALGFSPGAAKYLKTLLKRYGPFKNFESLYQFVENFPVDSNDSKRKIAWLEKGRLVLRHRKWYKPNDTIAKASLESLKKILPGIMEKGVFRLDNKEEFDFTRAFLKGESIIFSFNDKEVGRVEINHYMGLIQELRNLHPESARYFVSIEEAHRVLGRGGQGEQKIDEIIDDFVLVCRKMSVGLQLLMPEVIDLSGKVLNDMKEIITGKFKGDNANKLISAMGYDERARIIPYLKFNRFTGREGREMLFYNQDYGSIYKYHPYMSPCEIHRETGST